MTIEPGDIRRIFHIESPDLGETWGPYTFFGDGKEGVDRNWISISPRGSTYITWQDAATASFVEVRNAQGAWTHHEGGPLDACITISPAIFPVAGEPLAACTVRATDGSYKGTRVLSIGQSVVEKALLPFARDLWPHLLALANGTLVMTEDDEGGTLFVSYDHGTTWSGLWQVNDVAHIDDGWVFTERLWTAVDPWDRIHVLMEASQIQGASHGEGDEHWVAHVILELDGHSIAETMLVDPAPGGLALSSTIGPPRRDDYNGLDFAGDLGVLAWTEGRGVEVTWLTPRFATA